VSDVARLVEDQFRMGFPHRIWVAGQVGAVSRAPGGALQFQLTAGSEAGPTLRLPAVLTVEALAEVGDVLDRMHDADVTDLVCPGRSLRAGGLLRYQFAEHRLEFAVTALDPTATTAGLAADRDAVRSRVFAERLPERQRVLSPPPAPTRLAVVGPAGSPAIARVVERVNSCGYAVHAWPVAVGSGGSGSLTDQLATAVTSASSDSDLVLLVRGEGRRLGLAPFDSYPVARAIAASPVPVLTGLGAADDATVADEVAYEAAPTALAAADSVIARLRAAADRLRTTRDEVRGAAAGALDRATAELLAARDEVDTAGLEAARRARTAESRRWRAMLIAAAILAVVLVAVAVAAHLPLLLIGLAGLAVVVGGVRWQRTAYTRREGSAGMIPEVGFTEVLERLRRIRDELALTSSPEKVHRLGDEARRLVERGEAVLGRPLDPVPAARSQGSEPRTEVADAANTQLLPRS
jgi:exonuclease VII large subunit